MKRLKKQKRKKKQTRNLISVQGVAIEDDLHTPCLFLAREVRFEKRVFAFCRHGCEDVCIFLRFCGIGTFQKGKNAVE